MLPEFPAQPFPLNRPGSESGFVFGSRADQPPPALQRPAPCSAARASNISTDISHLDALLPRFQSMLCMAIQIDDIEARGAKARFVLQHGHRRIVRQCPLRVEAAFDSGIWLLVQSQVSAG